MAERKLTRKEKQAASQQNKQHSGHPRKQTEAGKKLQRSLGIFLAVLAFTLYANTLGHGYTHDDFSVIKENSVVTQGTGDLGTIMKTTYRYGYQGMNDGTYRPLSLIMFAIEWSLSPDNPGLGHFVNVILYALTAWLLFSFLVRIMRNYNLLVPFITTLIFIVHPLHTEVVASIKSRDEIMCFLLSVLALHYMFNYLENNKRSQLAGSAICFFLALLSKETAITMLAIIPLTVYFFSDIKLSKNIASTAILLVPALIFLAIRAKVIGGGGAHDISMADNIIAGAASKGAGLATAFYVLGQYIKLLVVPYPMISDYSLNLVPLVKFSDPFCLFGLLFHIGIGVYAIKKLSSKDPIAYAILFYLITIALFSNILIIIGATMAERFLYFPSLGYGLVVALLLAKVTRADTQSRETGDMGHFFKQNTVLFGIIGVAALGYSFMTISRNPDWKDNLALYSKDAVSGKESYRLHYYYGRHLIKDVAQAEADTTKRKALLEKGIAELQEAIRIYPEYSEAYSQMGVGYTRINDFDKAIAAYEIGIKKNPGDAIALNNLATVFFAQRKIKEAIDAFQRVTVLNPRYADAFVNLGSCYGTIGDYKNSVDACLKALAIEPNNTKAMMNLAQTYGYMGDKQNADLYYSKAVQIDPSLKRQ